MSLHARALVRAPFVGVGADLAARTPPRLRRRGSKSPWAPSAAQRRSLNECLLLAALVHLLLVVWIGNVPGGHARSAARVPGSLTVTLRGYDPARAEATAAAAPIAPPHPRDSSGVRSVGEPITPAPIVEQSAPGAVEPKAQTPTETTDAATITLPSSAMAPEFRAPELALPAPPPVTPVDEAPRPPTPAEPIVEAPAPPLRAATPPPPEQPAAPPLAEPIIAAPTPPPTPQPAAQVAAPPAIAQPKLAPLPAAPPLASPPIPLEPVVPPTPHEVVVPAAPPAMTVDVAPATHAPAAAEPMSPAPEARSAPGRIDGAAAREPEIAAPAPTAASVPPLDLQLPRARRGDLSARPTPGLLLLLPRPPERPSKLATDIENAARPDCRTAHAGMGLLAVVPLAANAISGSGCKW